MVCCFDAFDPIPDEPATLQKDLVKQGGETTAPIETLESKTADESDSDDNEVGEDEEEDDELEENEDLEEILVSGKPKSKTFECTRRSSHKITLTLLLSCLS
jgi:TATA-binding protein-associated factor Taf7